MRLEEDISHQIPFILEHLADVLKLSIGLKFDELEAVRSYDKHIQPWHGSLESAGIFSAESPAVHLDRVKDGILISHGCSHWQPIEFIPFAHLALDLRLSADQGPSL